MPLLVRKISRTKWPQDNYDSIQIDSLRADAITGLKTNDDKLSTWEVESEDSIEEAVLALASGFQTLETVHVVWMDKEEVIGRGFQIIEDSDGRTPVKDLVKKHRDIAGLNYRSLGLLASIILESLRDQKVKTFTRKQVRDILIQAVLNRRLDVRDLEEDVRKDVLKHLQKGQGASQPRYTLTTLVPVDAEIASTIEKYCSELNVPIRKTVVQ